MKKFLIIMLILLAIITFPKSEETFVFKEESEEYHLFLLTWNELEVSTKNFETIFFNKKVKSIYPYVSNLYSKKLKVQQYAFDHQSIAKNIEKFSSHYIRKLEDNGYKKDALSYQINGIPLISCVIYDTLEGIQILGKFIPHLEYKIIDEKF